jgi:uncharacterized protein (DUF2062 family)
MPMIRRRLQRMLPSEETLRSHRSLRWLGPLLRRPWLWQLSRRRVAAGAAIGVFFGFLFPVLQIALAAIAALVLRANLPVAAVSTLVSNPLTYAPIAVAAYKTGAALLGEPADAADARAQADALVEQVEGRDTDPRTRSQQLLGIGKPLMLGLAVFAVVGGAVTWIGVNVAWLALVAWRRRRRGRHRRAHEHRP